MRTSDPHVFAVGDVVASQRPAATASGRRRVEQAQVAAATMLGGEAAYRLAAAGAAQSPGIDLLSIGVVDAPVGRALTVAVSAYGARRYRKLVLENGRSRARSSSATPSSSTTSRQAVEQRLELGSDLDALEHGKWEALSRALEGETLAR